MTRFPRYDTTHLPSAELEFIVLGDTHFILNPESYAVEFDSVRSWPERVETALVHVAAMTKDFTVHLGDVAEENPANSDYFAARNAARQQMARCGVSPYFVAGNTDIGDKPDDTMWADPVSGDSLEAYHELFGPSWYSFDRGNANFVVTNSQIIDADLPQTAQQVEWLESDLRENAEKRIFIFTHVPLFFVDEEEPDTGFYNSLNEPGRSWLTELLRTYDVEILFTGHTHFRAFNRVGGTRFMICPSTTTSRAGFYEAFVVDPPVEQGRNDPAKLGFYLVRIYKTGHAVHFIRTEGATRLETSNTGSLMVTRISRDLPDSPLGLFLRTPLAFQTEGALAWPSVLRQRVRDDHPFLSCLEVGARHVRVPVSDLDDPLQCTRLQLLREEGVNVTAIWVWSNRLQLQAEVEKRHHLLDTVELQTPGRLWPEDISLDALTAVGRDFGLPTVLTPIISKEAVGGKYHPRTRFGFRSNELRQLKSVLVDSDSTVDRILCHMDPARSPWAVISELVAELPHQRIGAVDLVLGSIGEDDTLNAIRVAEALFGMALLPGCRLHLDPFVDLDRTDDVCHGLLDRLGNPRPSFHVARVLNSVLFSDVSQNWEAAYTGNGGKLLASLQDDGTRLRLVTDRASAESIREQEGATAVLVDLCRGMKMEGPPGRGRDIPGITTSGGPCVIITTSE